MNIGTMLLKIAAAIGIMRQAGEKTIPITGVKYGGRVYDVEVHVTRRK